MLASSLLAAPLRVSMCIAPTALATLTSPLFPRGLVQNHIQTPRRDALLVGVCCGGEELHALWVGVAVALPAVTAYNNMMIPAHTTYLHLACALGD